VTSSVAHGAVVHIQIFQSSNIVIQLELVAHLLIINGSFAASLSINIVAVVVVQSNNITGLAAAADAVICN